MAAAGDADFVLYPEDMFYDDDTSSSGSDDCGASTTEHDQQPAGSHSPPEYPHPTSTQVLPDIQLPNLPAMSAQSSRVIVNYVSDVSCDACRTSSVCTIVLSWNNCNHRACRECLSLCDCRAENGRLVCCPVCNEGWASVGGMVAHWKRRHESVESGHQSDDTGTHRIERLACRTQNCASWIVVRGDEIQGHCPQCLALNCISCKALHAPHTCSQYQRALDERRSPEDNSRPYRVITIISRPGIESNAHTDPLGQHHSFVLRHFADSLVKPVGSTAHQQCLEYCTATISGISMFENPRIRTTFEAEMRRLQELYPDGAEGKPILAFHGTPYEKNLDGIFCQNFRLDLIKRGLHGRGVYFATNPLTAQRYAGGSSGGRLILCRILPGKSHSGDCKLPPQRHIAALMRLRGVEREQFERAQLQYSLDQFHYDDRCRLYERLQRSRQGPAAGALMKYPGDPPVAPNPIDFLRVSGDRVASPPSEDRSGRCCTCDSHRVIVRSKLVDNKVFVMFKPERILPLYVVQHSGLCAKAIARYSSNNAQINH